MALHCFVAQYKRLHERENHPPGIVVVNKLREVLAGKNQNGRNRVARVMARIATNLSEETMQTAVQITVRGMEHSAALDEHIRTKAAKLEQYLSPVISCRVVVEAPHKRHHQGRHYVVRLDITVPGHEIVVNQEHDEEVYVALRDAFDAAKRQLEDYAHIRRGETRKGRSVPKAEALEELEKENE
jgi:ribosomal subunit interface protein